MPNYTSNMSLYLAIDQGGHATRARVFDIEGAIIAQAEIPINTIHSEYNNLQTVELDPQQLITSVKQSVQLVAEQLGERCKHLIAAGLVTQRSTIACWDGETGSALYPIISWQDTRAHKWLSQFTSKRESVHDITGLFLSPHYGASKMHWCLEHVAAVREAYQKNKLVIGPLSSFLTFHMLDEQPLKVDPANATRTLLWNKKTHDWDNGLLTLFEVPQNILPECVATRHMYGHLPIKDWRIPLQIVIGDQSAAIFSQGIPQAEICYINMGSGAFILRCTESNIEVSNSLLTGVVYQDAKKSINVVEATVNGAGNAMQWFKQHYNCNELEEQLADWLRLESNGLLFVNGIAGLGSPYWLPEIRSYFSAEGTIAEKAVALLESVIFLLQVNLDVMEKTLAKASKIFISGGLAQQDGLCQRLADLALRPVVRSSETEATSKGLAYLIADFPTNWAATGQDVVFLPQENHLLHERFHLWQELMNDAVNKVLKK